MTKLEAIKQQLNKAVNRLDDVLKQDKTEYMRDSAIQRFEFTFDLSWKMLKTYLEDIHGIISNSPKATFREAYKQELLEYDEIWLEITDARNQIAHMYKEKLANELYDKLPLYLKSFKRLISI
ncbi:MAG: HI0074 family nucleotidyltransferase substrate-binding subunit [Pseudomonadota bacterium]